ncbi:MAG: M1 family metallopeptidase [Chitinophagales bacterium]
MKKIVLNTCLFLLAYFVSLAQYNPIAPPNTFQSTENPYYWRNKKPYTDYWQQDVYYKIHATINEETDIIIGNEQLVYWNNSPDTLFEVYFHLYQNAFQPGSYYDNLYHNNGQIAKYGKYESAGLGTTIDDIKIDGATVKTTLDNTILIVHLNEPILPQSSVKFDINFKTYYDNGSVRRRMKFFETFGQKQYNGCHWYPRIAVYDKKFGWTTDQHLGREFYGDFGTYDVTLNFASNYIVAATGKLQNENEVLPKELREKIDIKNFKNKPWNATPSVIIPYKKGERKEWHFYAENIHDFAFTASPHYRIGEAHYILEGTNDTITAYSFAQESHASGWQNAAEYTAKVLQVYSEDIGMYGYHKMIVADARDGMEYPMLTLDGGSDPGYRGLLAHEVGHNWFYGMVNNNETYRAFMDEGFTQFLTAWAEERIDGKYIVENKSSKKYIAKYKKPRTVRDDEVYYGYIRDAAMENDAPLNTHSDGFNGAIRHGGGYGHVYYKTAAMLYNLQYTLGDDLFKEALQYYFKKWSFCHPYPEDFRQSIIEYTHTDLNWFFDQWLETTKVIDYKVGKVKAVKNEENTYEINFKRKGRMQMPIDFRVVDNNNRTFDYYIPNTYFQKETHADTLPKWTGWDKVYPKYTAKVTLPQAYKDKKVKIKNVIIDPSYRLADANILNNSKKGKVEWRFDSHVWNFPEWKKYIIYYRPDIWWNGFDGLKLGWHLNGNYMNRKHIFSFTAWYNTRLLQGNVPSLAGHKFYTNDRISFNFEYKTALDRKLKNTDLSIQARYLDGLVLGKIQIDKQFNNGIKSYINYKRMIRPESNDVDYLLYANEWSNGQCNGSVEGGLSYDFRTKHDDYSGTVALTARTSASPVMNYQYATFEFKDKYSFWRMDLKSRLFVRMGTKNPPPESALYFAGANGEEMVENKYVRAAGFYPKQWVGSYGAVVNHFHYGGGLNMRGYSGYLVYETDNTGTVNNAYRGNSGAAMNIELDFDRIIKWKKLPKLKKYFDIDTYLFADAGTIRYTTTGNNQKWSNFRADAGAGISFTIKRWLNLYDVKPFTIRFDVPFYISHAPPGENNVKFRWQIGINRAF